jgi:hypothetical protein
VRDQETGGTGRPRRVVLAPPVDMPGRERILVAHQHHAARYAGCFTLEIGFGAALQVDHFGEQSVLGRGSGPEQRLAGERCAVGQCQRAIASLPSGILDMLEPGACRLPGRHAGTGIGQPCMGEIACLPLAGGPGEAATAVADRIEIGEELGNVLVDARQQSGKTVGLQGVRAHEAMLT